MSARSNYSQSSQRDRFIWMEEREKTYKKSIKNYSFGEGKKEKSVCMNVQGSPVE